MLAILLAEREVREADYAAGLPRWFHAPLYTPSLKVLQRNASLISADFQDRHLTHQSPGLFGRQSKDLGDVGSRKEWSANNRVFNAF